ncbi:hypothetical protein P153DRAFT_434374 [Dothidotthia symphoricarpi CBS 119687]|uniref:Uncharacterized protein n=1 Tax=Dothidotthia symphoricarpi CBS 119687 TaxID=1392245 RepID=A0A6A6A2Z3_9PLEO|nr:uncharacterized protein P153DRAFT_434374 [Dothidotthia symphoricarpi CBS 119687]KAF2125277.1 hypothetical protein P153DRAFT_434374 [Dothidotthia symphoricarpi CBS 119687]
MFFHAQCAAAKITAAFRKRHGDEVIFKTDRLRKSPRDKYGEDEILILEMLPEFLVLTLGTERSPAEDELTRSLRITFKTHKSVSLDCIRARTLRRHAQPTTRPVLTQLSDTVSFARINIKKHASLPQRPTHRELAARERPPHGHLLRRHHGLDTRRPPPRRSMQTKAHRYIKAVRLPPPAPVAMPPVEVLRANPPADAQSRIRQRMASPFQASAKPRPQKLKVAVVQLQSILRAGLQAEILELGFDYLTLHRFCWRLLRAVKDKCRDALVGVYGPDYIERQNQLPFVVGYVFATATGSMQLADSMKMKRSDEVTSAVLRDAAGVVEQMLDAGAGDVVGMVMREKLGVPFEIQDSDDEEDGLERMRNDK